MIKIVCKTRSGDVFTATRDEERAAVDRWVNQVLNGCAEWVRFDGDYLRISELESISILETSFPGGDA
ncbi:hypothetical protein [Halomonas elongata]|uniref:hypothetical protein n=1 Tax=Halomonas elongata TaxID=2746 RepID=UPI00186B5C5C|nr:hypothetical protein [Halomonas elongata]MBW5800086.1 hypothetical protein [Halomonas elongata]